MTPERSGLFATGAAVVLLGLCGADAAADVTKDQCVDANTQAQSLRRQGRLGDAREKLRVCVDAACPSLVRDDCAERLDELNRAQPTIVVDVKDGDGNDLSAVKLTVDGRMVADRLAGTAIPLDPGAHTFVFESAGWQPLTRRFVLKETEKNRRERVMMVAAVAPVPQRDEQRPPAEPTPAAAEPPPVEHGGALGTRKILALAAGGAGIASVTVGAVLGLGASQAYSDQKRDCASPTECPNHAQALSDHSTMETDGVWSTVAFVAGGALLAGAAWLFFTGGEDAPAPSAAIVTPTIGQGSGGVVLRGAF
jgi:hypothetical protein